MGTVRCHLSLTPGSTACMRDPMPSTSWGFPVLGLDGNGELGRLEPRFGVVGDAPLGPGVTEACGIDRASGNKGLQASMDSRQRPGAGNLGLVACRSAWGR